MRTQIASDLEQTVLFYWPNPACLSLAGNCSVVPLSPTSLIAAFVAL